MKIRIKDNSLRYRLTKSEVQILCSTGELHASTDFGVSRFYYSIKVQEQVNELDAEFVGDCITLFFSKTEAASWTNSDRITYKCRKTWAKGSELSLLLEKDFVCLDHTEEDQSDNFPNPNKTC
jgi:hypothetical protein